MKSTLEKPDALWRLLITLVIVMAAGPEIFAAMELRILLELLGAALFTTAFIVGGRLLLLSCKDFAVDLLTPAVPRAALRGSVAQAEWVLAATWLLSLAVWWVELAIGGMVGVQAFLEFS